MKPLAIDGARAVLAEAGYPVFYGDDDGYGEMPYVAMYESGTYSRHADDRTFHAHVRYTAELYTRDKDPDAEAAVQAALDSHGIAWSRDPDMRNAEEGWVRIDYTFSSFSRD